MTPIQWMDWPPRVKCPVNRTLTSNPMSGIATRNQNAPPLLEIVNIPDQLQKEPAELTMTTGRIRNTSINTHPPLTMGQPKAPIRARVAFEAWLRNMKNIEIWISGSTRQRGCKSTSRNEHKWWPSCDAISNLEPQLPKKFSHPKNHHLRLGNKDDYCRLANRALRRNHSRNPQDLQIGRLIHEYRTVNTRTHINPYMFLCSYPSHIHALIYTSPEYMNSYPLQDLTHHTSILWFTYYLNPQPFYPLPHLSDTPTSTVLDY